MMTLVGTLYRIYGIANPSQKYRGQAPRNIEAIMTRGG